MEIKLGLCAIAAVVSLGFTALLVGGSVAVDFGPGSVRVQSGNR